MNLFGYQIRKASKDPVRSEPQIRSNQPQGLMTGWFQDYCLRKVSGEFYEILREGIPIIDAAIRRLISLNGTIKIIGDNPKIVKELEDFCLHVPVNDTQKGIHAFLENASNETFEQGFSLSEFVATKDLKDIAGLRVADSKNIVYRRDADGVARPWYRYPGVSSTPANTYSRPESVVQQILTATYNQPVYVAGMFEVKLRPENKLYFSINNENTDPYGVSIMRSMEFCAKILMTMQNSMLNTWERFGDPPFHMQYKCKQKNAETLEARRQVLSDDLNTALTAKREGRSADFVTATDLDSTIEITVIGADGQVLDGSVPFRHVLEQLISKTNLPAWMLSIYWSTTERMATLEVESVLQDAKIRQLAMTPEFDRLFSIYLRLRGYTWKNVTHDLTKPGDWGFVFETPNLRDLVAQAQARFLNAQADMMQDGVAAAGTQTNVNVGGASVDINGTKYSLASRHKSACSCKACGAGGKKELYRPTDWPQLDQVEDEYEAALKEDWGALANDTFEILGLTDLAPKAAKAPELPEGVPTIEKFNYSSEQVAAIKTALKNFLDKYDWRETDSAVRWYYGQSYSLGLLRAVEMIGEELPVLDIVKNKQIFDEITKNGFELVKNSATLMVKDKILAEMKAQVEAGANPRHVAARLKTLFDDKNSDWERLARSEISLAAEKAKLDEWNEWDVERVDYYTAPDACPICLALIGTYEIAECPLPVADTHPRCRCSLRPADREGH